MGFQYASWFTGHQVEGKDNEFELEEKECSKTNDALK